MALIQLPNGDWINPEDVVKVLMVTRFKEDGKGETLNPVYSVKVFSRIDQSCILCQSAEESQIIRDKIAEQVNKSLYVPE